MGKLAATTCETSKANKARDRLLGDGDGLFLRIRPHGTKTWVIEYEFVRVRRKYTIGAYDTAGSPGESISDWLRHGRLSLTQARSIAGAWKTARRGGHDPIVEWEATLAGESAADSALRAAIASEASMPTVAEAVTQFLAKHIAGKKSAPAIGYRLERLASILGTKKIRDVTRQEIITALEHIAAGKNEGRTATEQSRVIREIAIQMAKHGGRLVERVTYPKDEDGDTQREDVEHYDDATHQKLGALYNDIFELLRSRQHG